jgi:hypothetical protein
MLLRRREVAELARKHAERSGDAANGEHRRARRELVERQEHLVPGPCRL